MFKKQLVELAEDIHIIRATPDDVPVVFFTGVGASQFANFVQNTLNIK